MSQFLARLFRLRHGAAVNALEGIPGPKPKYPFGTALDFVGRKPWEVCAEYARRYGGMTLIWLLGKPALVLNDPTLIGEVLDTNAQAYYKQMPGPALAPVITPECLFIANGDHWAFMRANAPINDLAGDEWMARWLPPLRDFIAEWVRRKAAEGRPLDLIDEFMRLCYDAYSLAIWGKLLGDENYAQFQTLARTGSARMTSPLLSALPPFRPKFYRDRRRWYGTMEDLLRQARSTTDPGARGLVYDVLRRGTKLDDRLLRLALSAPIYFGGGFSMASGALTTLYFLARNPEAAERVQGELRRRIPQLADLDLAGLRSCSVLDAALRETLRLLGPVPLYFRNVRTTGPVQLGGRTIPADTLLFITNWHLHLAPEHWREPERYDLSRWENGGAEANPFGSDYFFPFGRGPRTCIGQPYALFFMKLVLAVVLTQGGIEFDLSRPLGQQFFFGVLMPKDLRGRFRTSSVKGS